MAVPNPSFDIGKHTGPVIFSGQDFVRASSAHMAGKGAGMVQAQEFGVRFFVGWDVQAFSVVSSRQFTLG